MGKPWCAGLVSATCFHFVLGTTAILSLSCFSKTGRAQTTEPQATQHTPAWLAPAYRSMLKVEVPSGVPSASQGQVTPANSGGIMPQYGYYSDSTGMLGTYQPGGATATGLNAFFQSLGTNGRTCATCHQPENAMGLSVTSIQQRYRASWGNDPVFAPVDGANCPSNAGPAGMYPANYSLLLNNGLFRIALPVPQNAQFTVSVVNDPYGCNTNPTYNQSTDPVTGIKSQILSIYRRPTMAANLKFKVFSAADTGEAPPIDLVTGLPLAIDPATGHYENGNIMSDGREPTLSSQALDATLIHAQAKSAPTASQIAQMVAFESGIYSAQYSDSAAGPLISNGVNGGPVALSQFTAGTIPATGGQVISAYNAWNPALRSQTAAHASIYRGQQIFNTRTFLVTNDEGINNIPGVPNAVPLQCSSCHGQVGGTSEPHPVGQHSLGIGGMDVSLGGPPTSTILPIFKITCRSGYTTPFNGSVILINDPGKALITGKCADIGRFTTPQLHGLAAHAPYFHDGSVAALKDVVSFYNKRFNIGLSAQDSADLVAFLNTL